MRSLLRISIVFCTTILLASCEGNRKSTLPGYALNENFGAYWHQGLAELASYDLEQVRYGEIRSGSAVLIFVTEDFSKSKQVKLDDPGSNPEDALNVLKLNATRKFTTGVYPYSTMTSVFTPIYQNIGTVKLSTSCQEWCGHTYLQANWHQGHYQVQGNSYFESEGDLNYEVPDMLMEDEIWNLIRLDHKALPTGTLEMLPGSLYCRLKHVDFKGHSAEATIEKVDQQRMTYHIEYPELQRSLNIMFNTSFPHEILGWEETYPENGQPMTTKASLVAVKQLDYWNKNKNADTMYRIELGLEKENRLTD